MLKMTAEERYEVWLLKSNIQTESGTVLSNARKIAAAWRVAVHQGDDGLIRLILNTC